MTTVNNFVALNLPLTNLYIPNLSVIPDRFNSISLPIHLINTDEDKNVKIEPITSLSNGKEKDNEN
jgi:hypothetical protein